MIGKMHYPTEKLREMALFSKIKKIKYVFGLCRKRQQEGHLSAVRQIMEIIWLTLTRGLGYSTYHYAKMWHKDARWAYKTAFLSHRDYGKKVFELNERKYHGITQFKPTEKAFFQFFNIPCVPFVGVLNEYWGVTHQGAALQNEEQFRQLLAQNTGKKVCFKLLEESGGKGFKAYEILEGDDGPLARHVSTGEILSLSALYEKLMAESDEGWLMEKYITQHPIVSKLNPSSINTIRMYVFQDKTGNVAFLEAFLRIGKAFSLVDNTAAGGFVARIDHEGGRLGKICIFMPEMILLSGHPDHGTLVEGVTIPFWAEAQELGIRTLGALPNTRFAGLDIAITEDGPILVEVNVQPDLDGLSFMQIETARAFNS